MKFLIYFFLCGIAIIQCGAAETIYDWTNTSGKTIRAQFVKSDGKTVTIIMSGRRFDYPLSNLTPESQALARKLSAGNSPTTEVDPFGKPSPNPVPGIKPKPQPEQTEDPSKKIRGKILLPTIGEGQWARYYAVTVGKNFDVAIHGNGRLYFFLKDAKGEVIGKPLRLSYRTGYYLKPEAQFGWPHAYFRDIPERHYKLRKLVSFETPSAPASASGFRRLELIANHEDGVKVEMGFEVSGSRVAIWGKPVDPRKNEHPSVMAIALTMTAPLDVNDEWGPADWTPLVGDTTLAATPAGSRRAVELPYLEKWEKLKEKGIYPNKIEAASLYGTLFGKRKVSLAPKSFRDAKLFMSHYSGIFPFQDYHFVYEDSRTGGEIDRGRRLEIEIR
ncbi:MAG: hypothetical protein VB980_03925 [Opitutales bacterium]|jgi:hypothetical protein